MPALRSSNLASADWQDGVCTIVFRSGGVYNYSGMEEEVYQGLLSAPSAGAYFAAVIKDAYPTERVS